MNVDKTQIIKEVLTHDFPYNTMIRASSCQTADSPFTEFRRDIKNFSGITKKRGVDFFDSDLDLKVLNQFIKSLPPLKEVF